MINTEKMPMYVIKGGGKGGRERGPTPVLLFLSLPLKARGKLGGKGKGKEGHTLSRNNRGKGERKENIVMTYKV